MTNFFRRKSSDSEMDDIAVEEQFLVPPLDLPNWQPHYKPEHMKTFTQLTPAEQDLLLIFSVAAEKVDFLVKLAMRDNEQQRRFGKELIAQRRWRRTLFRRWAILIAGLSVLLTAFASGFMVELAKRIFQ